MELLQSCTKPTIPSSSLNHQRHFFLQVPVICILIIASDMVRASGTPWQDKQGVIAMSRTKVTDVKPVEVRYCFLYILLLHLYA